jgi:plasmid stabilization system protein ParE
VTRFRVFSDAESDLDEIFLYWAQRAGLEAADRLIDSITERFWLLGEHPDAGRPMEDGAKGVKCFSSRQIPDLLPQDAPRDRDPAHFPRRSRPETGLQERRETQAWLGRRGFA